MQTEVLGSVSFPSGAAVVVDTGLLESDGLEFAKIVDGLPDRKKTHQVLGVRVGEGEWGDCWREVWVQLRDDEPTQHRKIGEVLVDCARLMFIDMSAVKLWSNKSMDGKADFVFWGGDAEALADAVGAPEIEEGEYGWCDLPVQEIVELGTKAEERKQKEQWRLKTDFRPHTQHYALLAQARDNETGSGTITIGESAVCMFFTSWGDGRFPVFVDENKDGEVCRLRVQLETKASVAAMEKVNR